MKRRVYAQAPIDVDAVSPDSISAAQRYVLATIDSWAASRGFSIDWNSYRTRIRSSRRENAVIVSAWAKIV